MIGRSRSSFVSLWIVLSRYIYLPMTLNLEKYNLPDANHAIEPGFTSKIFPFVLVNVIAKND